MYNCPKCGMKTIKHAVKFLGPMYTVRCSNCHSKVFASGWSGVLFGISIIAVMILKIFMALYLVVAIQILLVIAIIIIHMFILSLYYIEDKK